MQTAILLLILFFAASVTTAAQGAGQRSAPATVQYDLTVNLQPDAHHLEATAVVQLPPATTERQTLPFALYSDMNDVRATVLSPQSCAGPATVRETRTDSDFSKNRHWELTPPHPLPRNTPLSLQIQYSGGQRPAFQFYLGPEGSFASAYGSYWYPRFDEGNETGTLRLAVPKGILVKATGQFVSEKDTESESLFTFRADKPTRFSFAAGHYLIHRREGSVPITLYLLKDRPFAEEFVDGMLKAHRVLVNEFGPYPFGEYAVVETPSPQSTQSGFSGASLAGFMLADTDTLDAGFDLAFFGHEMSHQWWGNLVTQEGYRGNDMMDEAMAQYGSLRCVEEMDGPQLAARYRSIGYPGYDPSQCGQGALLFAAAGLDQPLGSLPGGGIGHYMADCKGFLVYSLLARTIGPDRFRKALMRIASAYAFRSITWDAFLQEIQRAAGQDLSWFYKQWFERKGVPFLSLQWAQQAGRLRITLTQAAPYYRLTLPVQIEFDNGEAVMQQIPLEGAKADQVLPERRRVQVVRLDPYSEVPHMTAQAQAEALRSWTLGTSLRQEGKNEDALKVFQEALQHLPTADPYGAEFLLRMGIGRVHQAAGQLDEAKHEYEQALTCPVRPADYLPFVYLRLAQIARSQGDLPRLQWAVRYAASADAALDYPTGAARAAQQLLAAP
ncbi:MAG TPA: hypothetical protein VKU00_31200 [Chthonomonadaceae bacterium]|nr:hypothetical protein [Chthonomonadaceae bacterium]